MAHGVVRSMLRCHAIYARSSAMSVILSTLALQGCSLNDLVSKSAPPADLVNPTAIQNAEGALAQYAGVLAALAGTMASGGTGQITDANARTSAFIPISGILTDELQVVVEMRRQTPPGFPRELVQTIDSRSLGGSMYNTTSSTDGLFSGLQTIRMNSREARSALQKYSTNTPSALRGHLYAIQALSEILLAEMYCSGIPLSIAHFEKGYTLTRGFLSHEVYQNAITLLDSATPLARDSIRIMNFINVLKGRAYVALDAYDSAAQAVATVPDEFQYRTGYSTEEKNFFLASTWWPVSMGNVEGENGLDYVTSHDPRTLSTLIVGPNVISEIRFPQKYQVNGLSPISIASGIEARLLRAEAELQRGDISAWLATLNRLRTSGSFTVAPNPTNATLLDTTWAPGTGATHYPQPFPGLRPLLDPGSDTARVSLLFRERAFWLFLTGHRQGDLRRLVRQYQRPEHTVYPIGYWGPLRVASYGSDVLLPVPAVEQELNPLYGGCHSYDA